MFLDLNSDTIAVELDDFWKELYKIQKIFANKWKKVQAQKEENDLIKKKRRQKMDSDEAATDTTVEPELVPPAALAISNTIQTNMEEFKVRSPTCNAIILLAFQISPMLHLV